MQPSVVRTRAKRLTQPQERAFGELAFLSTGDVAAATLPSKPKSIGRR